MHILQPKHTKLSEKESQDLLEKLNISKAQLPKIFLSDSALPEKCQTGDIVKIERSSRSEIHNPSSEDEKEKKISTSFRVVV